MPEVVIGTVQFGLDYGVANLTGQVGAGEVRRILDRASSRACRWIDTAHAYGEAETVLGQTPAFDSFQVSSKFGADTSRDPAGLSDELSESLSRLGRQSIDIMLLHRSDWLRGDHGPAVRRWMDSERALGRIHAFGVSVYDLEEIDVVLAADVEWVQLPMSILAQNWINSGSLDRLRKANVRIQARSLLAQGLVAVDPAKLPVPLAALRGPLEALQRAARQLEKSPVALALGFAAQAPIDMMVIGVETQSQLDACLDAIYDSYDLPWAEFACTDDRVIDPRFWPSGMRVAI